MVAILILTDVCMHRDFGESCYRNKIQSQSLRSRVIRVVDASGLANEEGK